MNKRTLRIGVTGNIGAGKSSFCKFLSDAGYPVINADLEAKKILESDPIIKEKIKKFFGEKAYVNDLPDTKFLAAKVFGDKSNQKIINSVIHPAVIKKINNLADDLEKKYNLIFIEAALIYESGMQEFLDYVVLISSEFKIRMMRKTGSGMTMDDFRKRDSFQISENEKETMADFVISNNGKLSELNTKAEFLLKIFLSLLSVSEKK